MNESPDRSLEGPERPIISQGWTIRQAGLSDLKSIAALYHEVAPLAFPGAEATSAMRQWLKHHTSEAVLSERLFRRDIVLLVAESSQGDVVGTGYLMSSGNSRGSGYIGGLYCRARGQGVGSALLSELLEVARRNQMVVVSMTAASANQRMVGLAERVGFRTKTRGPDNAGFFKMLTFDELEKDIDKSH